MGLALPLGRPAHAEGSGRGRLSAVVRLGTLTLALVILMRAARLPAAPVPHGGLVAVVWPSTQALDLLGTVWYYTYGFEGPVPTGHHRVFMALPHHDEERLIAVMRAHPGSWWMVGNEPNDPHQDNLSPHAYAAFYRRFGRLAQRVDPTARLMPAGIANADWQWADAFREAYRAQYGRHPRVDAWNVHNYVLEPERDQLDQEIFRARLVAFREWMVRAGEGHKPLVLSEFGALMGGERQDTRYAPPEAIVAYIHDTVAWLQATDLVQAWAWFANYTDGLFNGDLYRADGTLSPYGEAYRDALAVGALRSEGRTDGR